MEITLIFPSENVSFFLNVLHNEVKMPHTKKWVNHDSYKDKYYLESEYWQSNKPNDCFKDPTNIQMVTAQAQVHPSLLTHIFILTVFFVCLASLGGGQCKFFFGPLEFLFLKWLLTKWMISFKWQYRSATHPRPRHHTC